MDFASFGIASVACITVICYLAATAVKQTPLANKWLPSICGALGGLLGLAEFVDHGAHAAEFLADEHDVAGQQKIAPPLYGIAAAAREKKHDLAEFVIVVINLRTAVVFQVKESEILQQVSALFIVFVHDGLHKSIFCKEYSIDCVYFARCAQ